MKSLLSFLSILLITASAPLFGQIPNVGVIADTVSICYPADSVQLQTTVFPGSGPGPYTYSWSPAAGLSDPASPNPWVNSPGISGYAVVVTNAFGSSLDSVFVVNGQFSVDLGPDIVTCDTVYLDATVSGGNYSYLWCNSNTSYSEVAGLNNGYGQYCVTVTDNLSGCVASDTIIVSEASVVNAALSAGPDTSACVGTSIWVLNPDPSWTYIWNDGSTTPSITLQTSGIYYVDVTDPVTACVGSDTVDAIIEPALIVSFTDSIVDCNTVYFTNTSVGTNFWWDFGDGITSQQANPVHTYSQAADFNIILYASNVCGTIGDSITRFLSPYCVWPGDADNDGIANNLDILALGQSFDSTGSARPNASIGWNGEPSYDWTGTLTNGTNFTYSDTDGNGIVNDDDTLAISQNYGFIHARSGATAMIGDPLLYLDMSVLGGNPANVGDTVSLPIMLGVDTLPVAELYGIAFSLAYDTSLVQSGSVSISADMSWLGSNLLKMHKDLPVQNMVDVGITRTDQIEESGFGRIGTFTFVMVDDIAKMGAKDSMMLDFTGVVLQRLDGSPIPVNTQGGQVVVEEGATNTGITPTLDWEINLYPNPSQGSMTLEIPAQRNAQLEIVDLMGRSVLSKSINQSSTQLDLSSLAKGVYLLKLQSPNGQWVQKIELRP
ncbi:MAG: T9SS type A sorting domain-containing protein [Bacteroidia bacterium]